MRNEALSIVNCIRLQVAAAATHVHSILKRQCRKEHGKRRPLNDRLLIKLFVF
jgi:hypothetical protein